MRIKSLHPFKVSALLGVFALTAISLLPARAEETGFAYSNPETGYVVYIDDAMDLLSQSDEQQLIEDMIPVTQYGNAGFISCENHSLSTGNYAEQRYETLFGNRSGSLLVLDTGMREFYIRNNGYISDIITTAYSNTIADNIYRYASDGEYYEFASASFYQELVLLEGGKISQPMRYISAALLALILGLMINYLFLKAVTARPKAGNGEIMDAADVNFVLRNPESRLVNTSKVYSPVRTGGGRSRGGGGGGGGFSGGGSGGGHRF